MIKVTKELLRKVNSCYSAAREKELIPENGLTIREVAALGIPAKDKTLATNLKITHGKNGVPELPAILA